MSYVTLNVKNRVFEKGVHYQTSPFGRRDGYFHQGIDMIGYQYAGDNIVAFADGTVYVNAYDDSRGNYIVLKHSNDTETHYYHMRNRSTLAQGTTVKKGQALGYMGTTGNSTGPHLHFGIRIGANFVNPLPYLEGKSVLVPVPKPVVPKSVPTSAPQKQDYISYTVQKGDSWWGIAQNKIGNGNRYMELVKFNGHSKAPAIFPGNIIKIPCETSTVTVKVPAKASAPAQRTYKVVANDSYWSIAQKFLKNGSRYKEIQKLNGNKSVIHPGDVLIIPNK